MIQSLLMGCDEGLRTHDGILVFGQHDVGESDSQDGVPAVAVFAPSAVSVFRQRPDGSPRNVFAVRLAALEPYAQMVRLRASAPPGGPDWLDGLAADVTPAAVADLGIGNAPGEVLWFAVKATEVLVHPSVHQRACHGEGAAFEKAALRFSAATARFPGVVHRARW